MSRQGLRVALALAVAEALVGASAVWALNGSAGSPIRPVAAGPPSSASPGSAAAASSAPASPPAPPPAPRHPSARAGAAMSYDPAHGRVVLFGGAPAGRPSDDTWTWDGSAWRAEAPAHRPSARTGAAMAFDSQSATLLLFGGRDGANRPLADSWKWDGADWVRLEPRSSPPPRSGAALAYDPAIGRAVLYGGAGGLSDTWTWSGDSWSPAGDAGQPGLAVPGAVLSYDARAGRLLLAGDETWALLAGRWSKVGAGPPAPCAPAAGVYDSALASPVVVGAAEPGALSVCAWTGKEWQPRQAEGAPPFRTLTQVAFDDRTSELVLFGGEGGSGSLLDDTWTWTPGRGWSQGA